MTDSRFDRSLALSFIGAPPKDPMGNSNAGQARAGEGGSDDPGPGRREGDAESAPLYLSTCDVRAVRRETRASSTGEQVKVVVVDFVASDETVDSHDSIVKCDFDLSRYNKNPVLLWSHNRDKDHLPIGRCENTRIEGGRLLATAVFFTRTQFQCDIAEAYASGECRMFSIGFYPGKYEFVEIGGKEILVLSQNKLVENSAVPVGSNENALAQKAWDALRTRARAAKTPTPPAPTTPRATPGAPKDHTMKTITVDVRAHRANPSSPLPCPACNEALGVALANVPEVDEKALAEATTRAATAEQSVTVLTAKATEAERALALSASELQSATARLAAMEPELATVRAENEKNRDALVAAEVEKRVSVKIYPNERASELRVAKLLLADRTADPEKPGSTLGEKAFAARLAEIDARPDLGLLGGSLVNQDAGKNTGARAEEARGLASEIDAVTA